MRLTSDKIRGLGGNSSANKILVSRLKWIEWLIIVTFILFSTRLWQLQIIEGGRNTKLADQNGIRNITLMAPRGVIVDRKGRPLVINQPSYNAYLMRDRIKNRTETLQYLSQGLRLPEEDVLLRLEKFRSAPSFQPIVIKEALSINDIAFIESHQVEHPEVRITHEPRRFYPYGSLAAHLIGYVGEISESQLRGGDLPDPKPGDIVGKAGLEKQYNTLLMGKDGKKRVVVNSLGREISELSRQDPIIGTQLTLTLDLDLQLAAERLLEDKTGTVVALNPQNGEVLAMASHPAFDPNSFASHISVRDWQELLSNADHPLQNRALQSMFSPGSVFKVIMAFAGLEENVLTPQTSVICSGGAYIYGNLFHCHKVHGFVNLNRAIAASCNVFFYNLGKNLGIERIARHAMQLGLGRKTNIDLPDEKSGLFPTPEWKERIQGEKWFAGETISVAIGQGSVTVTPIQLAKAISAIASGKISQPHVLLHPAVPTNPTDTPQKKSPADLFTVLHADTNKETQYPMDGSQTVLLSDRNRQIVVRGMWSVVNEGGTGGAARITGLDVCGKTGTAQLISLKGKSKLTEGEKSRFEHNAWFVGFAPRDNPELMIVVMVEHGGAGGRASAPIAGALFREYFVPKPSDSLPLQQTTIDVP
ncbi:MAG: penicillin-binding protein 2 [Acidobacteria bacterium]|nr:penicillin-binding protein 2 [Acidobacteriota bacterium]MBI3655347.1 penicillin-binding protein 2 [Acidobacteriota bacterium]